MRQIDREPDSCASNAVSDKYWNYFTINLALLVTKLNTKFLIGLHFSTWLGCVAFSKTVIYDLFLVFDI